MTPGLFQGTLKQALSRNPVLRPSACDEPDPTDAMHQLLASDPSLIGLEEAHGLPETLLSLTDEHYSDSVYLMTG